MDRILGAADGVPNGTADGAADGVADGITDGIADGVANGGIVDNSWIHRGIVGRRWWTNNSWRHRATLLSDGQRLVGHWAHGLGHTQHS